MSYVFSATYSENKITFEKAFPPLSSCKDKKKQNSEGPNTIYKHIHYVSWKQYGPVLKFYPRTDAGGQSNYTVHYFLHYGVVREEVA